MKNDNSLILVGLGIFLFTMIGVIVGFFFIDILKPTQPTEGLLAGQRFSSVISALIWLLVCVVTFFGTGKIIKEGERIGLSLTLLVIWIFCTAGVLVGTLAWLLYQGGSLTIDLDLLLDSWFSYLASSLAPTFSAALAISNKRYASS